MGNCTSAASAAGVVVVGRADAQQSRSARQSKPKPRRAVGSGASTAATTTLASAVSCARRTRGSTTLPGPVCAVASQTIPRVPRDKTPTGAAKFGKSAGYESSTKHGSGEERDAIEAKKSDSVSGPRGPPAPQPEAASLPSEPATATATAAAMTATATATAARAAAGTDKRTKKAVRRSSSILEQVMEDRDEEGDLTSKVVHMELAGGVPIEAVYDGVHDGKELGRGVSGPVRRVTHRSTGVQYAVKCLDLALVETDDKLRQLREEICIMCRLDHPNIVRLEEVYESSSDIYLVQELCPGGELFDRLEEQPGYRYDEGRCAELVAQILSAVQYLHSKGIVHRDLKLENFLFSGPADAPELRMIDFGLSKHFRCPGESHRERVGTPYSVAPEVIRGCYDEKCDLWAVGVLAYLLLSGEAPFGGCDGEPLSKVRANILSGRYSFDDVPEAWKGVSDGAKGFVQSLLAVDPRRRPTAEEALRSPWLVEWAVRGRGAQGYGEPLHSNVVDALFEFRRCTDLQRLLCEVLSFTLLPDQIERMRKEFRKVDAWGKGEISLSDLKTAFSRVCRERATATATATAEVGEPSRIRLADDEIKAVFDAMCLHRAFGIAASAEEEKQEEAAAVECVQWHEFIAAGLGLCRVDERNVRLAFDRLDANHKGYVSFDDVLELSGGGGRRKAGGRGGGKENRRGHLGEGGCGGGGGWRSVREERMRQQWRDLTSLCGGGGRRDAKAEENDHDHAVDDLFEKGCISYEDFRFLMERHARKIRVVGLDGSLSSPFVYAYPPRVAVFAAAASAPAVLA